MHPLNVESVAWVAERKSLLCTLFFLLALWAYGWYARTQAWKIRQCCLAVCIGADGQTNGHYAAVCSVTAGLLAVTEIGRVQFQCSLCFRCHLSKLFTEKLPLFAMAAASALITVYAQHRGGALGITAALPFSQRIKNAIYSYLAYIFQRDLAFTLAVFYPHRRTHCFMESAGLRQ